MDTTLRYKNDNQTGQFGNQRTMTIAEARETVGGQVVQKSGIQCFNCNEFGHFAKECRKPKRVKDSTYHKEKMLMCKQAEKGVLLQVEQSNWLADTDEEIDEQELEAHYSYMAKIQEVPTADSGTDSEPLEQVQYDVGYNVFANETQHSEQPESTSNTCLVEQDDSNVIPDSPDMCDNDIQNDQNAVECDDERVALANLIANLKLDVDENKKIQKQLKKANTTLAHELTECKSILAETSRTLGESNSIRDSCLVALQNKQTEFERYKNLNDRTVDYEKLEHKLNETLGLLAQKDIDIKEGLKLKAYEISVVKEKHDELVKQSLLTKSHYEGLVKEKTKVITDLKLKEEKDIDKMISMEKQLKFLNEIVYKRSQSIQTIHMLAPKCPTFNGRPTFANPMYLKKAQYEKPCLYEIPHDQSDPANRLVPDREETLTLEIESRSKLNKDLVKPYDYTKLNSLYEIFKPPTQEYLVQLAHANEQEMHADLKYVESLEKEINELESDKAEFSNMYDTLLQEYLKAQLQDKNIAICDLNKLIEKCKGKSVETKFDKPSVVRQPTAFKSERPRINGFEVVALSAKYEGKEMGHFAKECRAPRNKEGQFRNQDNTRKHGNNEDTSLKGMLAIDGVVLPSINANAAKVYTAMGSNTNVARRRQSVENVQTYTRRSRLVSTVDVSTDSQLGSTAGVKAENKGKAIMQEFKPLKKIKKRVQVQMSVDAELAKKLFEEEQAKFKAEHQQEKSNFETALELQKQLDEREEVVAQAHNIDWSDPAVLRYHTLQNRPFSVAKDEASSFVQKQPARGTRKKSLARKRARETRSEESAKKQKLEDDNKKEELQVYLNIVPEEESLNIESLATKQDVAGIVQIGQGKDFNSEVQKV
ncbi:retrovirus-related pol polyprotein from transposon TNT 1-94 [Tanacetum coccineum]